MSERHHHPEGRHVDGDLIQRLESLAGLRLGPGEREILASQLNRIVAFVAQLQQLDTSHAPADDTAAPRSEADVSLRRKDQPRASLPRQEVLAQAPATDGCFFNVPPVFMPNPSPWQNGEGGAGDE